MNVRTQVHYNDWAYIYISACHFCTGRRKEIISPRNIPSTLLTYLNPRTFIVIYFSLSAHIPATYPATFPPFLSFMPCQPYYYYSGFLPASCTVRYHPLSPILTLNHLLLIFLVYYYIHKITIFTKPFPLLFLTTTYTFGPFYPLPPCISVPTLSFIHFVC